MNYNNFAKAAPPPFVFDSYYAGAKKKIEAQYVPNLDVSAKNVGALMRNMIRHWRNKAINTKFHSNKSLRGYLKKYTALPALFAGTFPKVG